MSLQSRIREGRVAVTRPNWRSTVSVEYEFETSVFDSHEHHERREALRVTPRVNVQYDTILTPGMYHRWAADMQTPNEPLVVACVWQRTTLSVTAPGGSLTLTVASVPSWLTAGVRLVLQSRDQEEAVTVESVAGNVITLTTLTTLTFLANDPVCYGLLAYADSDTEFVAETNRLLTGSVRYAGVPGDNPITLTGTVPAKIGEEEVFPFKPNWRTSPRIIPTVMRDVFDPGRGRLLITSTVNRLTRVQKMGFTATTTAQINDLTAFFLRHKGRRGSFWVPSFMRDLDLVSATSTTLTVGGTDFLTAFAGSDHHTHLGLRDPATGALVVREITGMSNVTGNTRITTASWGFTPSVSDDVSWVFHARFASDILEVRYLTDSRAEVEFAIETLRKPT